MISERENPARCGDTEKQPKPAKGWQLLPEFGKYVATINQSPPCIADMKPRHGIGPRKVAWQVARLRYVDKLDRFGAAAFAIETHFLAA